MTGLTLSKWNVDKHPHGSTLHTPALFPSDFLSSQKAEERFVSIHINLTERNVLKIRSKSIPALKKEKETSINPYITTLRNFISSARPDARY